MLKKESLVVGAVVFLFFGLAVLPSTNADIYKSCKIIINEGNLSGYVFDTDSNPIEGALVRVYFHETYEEGYSDENGYYNVDNIPICYCLKNCTCFKVGYEIEWVLLSIVEDTTYDFILTLIDPVPDLDCEGDLAFGDVEPGETLTGTVSVENIGETGSLLNWEIESYPDWGTWSFEPESGTDLLAGDTVDIAVEIIAPEEPETEFDGEVVFVNSDNASDYCAVSVSLPFNYNDYNPIQLVFLLINKLRNYEGIECVELKEDVLEIIESDEELSGIVEKLKRYNCGCEGEETLEWTFPIICIILTPLFFMGAAGFFMTGQYILVDIALTLMYIFNYWWY